MTSNFNEQDVRKFYKILNHTNETEIRVINPHTKVSVSYHAKTEDEFVATCKVNNGKFNIYVGMNERTENGTQEVDVQTVRFFLLDIDAVRADAKEPATEAEKNKAIEEANKIKDSMIKKDYQEPLMYMSGNGVIMLLRLPGIKITKDNINTIKAKFKVLQNGLIAKYNSEVIKIDPISSDLARICKVPGTLSIKGRSTDERPHRVSYIINNPSLQPDKKMLDNIMNLQEEVITNMPLYKDITEQVKKIEEVNTIKERDAKLKKLLSGDSSGYESRSEADMALMIKLAYYKFTKEQCFKIFDNSSREKWKEKRKTDYGERLYKKAVETIIKDAQKMVAHYNPVHEIGTTSKVQLIKNDKMKWNKLKELMIKRWYDSETLQFLYNKSFKAKGKVINKIYDDVKKMTVAYTYDKKEETLGLVTHIGFFDDMKELKYKKIKQKLNLSFYVYMYYAENKKYILLSKEEIDNEMNEISGTLIHIKDKITVGENAFFAIDTPVIVVSEIKSFVQKYKSFNELLEDIKEYQLNHNKLFNWLFSRKSGKSYRHPKLFEEMLLATMLSSRRGFDEYPLNVLVIGSQGTGKSWLLEELHSKINESTEIVEGSGSTIKTLIPTFKNSLAEPGSFLKANRICFIDEFFRILLRTPIAERNDVLTVLNPILEHKLREFGSGNSRIKAQATAKLLAVTNPRYGLNSVSDLVANVDNSFLARLFIWNQTKEHTKEIRNKSGCYEDTFFEFDNNTLLGIYDYLNSIEATFDEQQVLTIFNKYTDMLPVGLADLYSNRFKHHIRCMLDGIIKSRCLFENDNKLEALDKDYDKLNEIWREMVEGWISIDLSRVDRQEKVKFLSSVEKYIYEEFVKIGVMWDYQLDSKFEKIPKDISTNAINKLISMKIIYRDGRKYILESKKHEEESNSNPENNPPTENITSSYNDNKQTKLT